MYLVDLLSPPALPPRITIPKRDERPEPIIMPDIRYLEHSQRIIHENFVTLVYTWMNRIHGFFEKVEVAKSQSNTYNIWLLNYHLKDGIPPHIQFGGGITRIPGGDPTFYSRWVEYVHSQLLKNSH